MPLNKKKKKQPKNNEYSNTDHVRYILKQTLQTIIER